MPLHTKLFLNRSYKRTHLFPVITEEWMRKLNYNLESIHFQNLFLCDSAHLIMLDINLFHMWINVLQLMTLQKPFKCKYTPVNKHFKWKNKYVFRYVMPFTPVAIQEEPTSSVQKRWCHIHRTVLCTVSAMRTSYLTSTTKVHVPILLHNKPSWAYPVYKILSELCKNHSDTKHACRPNLSIIYSFYMLHTNNKLQPYF